MMKMSDGGVKATARRARIGLLAGAGLLALGSPLHAEETVSPPDAQDPEIVVTVLRRATAERQAPAAITRIGGQDLRDQQIRTLEDIAAKIPGVHVGTTVGSTHVTIRGVGLFGVVSGLESPVAILQDGVYLPQATPLDSLLMDVASVEVLRGPQGTLYGRNATGGVLNFVANAPTRTFHGYATLGFGANEAVRAEAAVSGPLAQGLSARIYGLHDGQYRGSETNIITGKRVGTHKAYGTRGSLRWEPREDLTIDASGLYYWGRGDPGLASVPITPVPASVLAANPSFVGAISYDPDKLALYAVGRHVQENAGAKLAVEWKIAPGLSVNSQTSYNDIRFALRDFDGNGIGAPTLVGEDNHTTNKVFQQDMSLKGQSFSDALDWILGGYYGHDELAKGMLFDFVGTALAGARLFSLNTQETRSIAGFADLTWHVVDRFDIYGGARWSRDRREAAFDRKLYIGGAPINLCGAKASTAATAFNNTTFKAGAKFSPDTRNMLYVQWQQGFKAGGFNACGDPFSPEKVDAFEAGYKGSLLDGALDVKLAAFHYNYRGMQVTQYFGTSSTITNAGASSITGVELETTLRPATGLAFDASLSFLPQAKYDEFTSLDPLRTGAGVLNLAGNRLVYTPRFTLNTGLEYAFAAAAGELKLRGEFYYNSGYQLRPFNVRGEQQNDFAIVNLFATFQPASADWSVRLWGRNLTDKRYVTAAANAEDLKAVAGIFANGRSFGAAFTHRW